MNNCNLKQTTKPSFQFMVVVYNFIDEQFLEMKKMFTFDI